MAKDMDEEQMEAPGTMVMIFGRRCFFCYVPGPDGRVWWFANPPRTERPEPDELDD